MYADYRGMEIDYTQVPLWQTVELEQYKSRNNKTVEEHLSTLRKKNLREKEEVVAIAQRIKTAFWNMDGGRAFRELRDKAGDKLTQQHSVVRTIRFSPNEALPAEAFRAPLLAKINKAMNNLYETNSQGIVLLVGGTGCGKSSVSPPACMWARSTKPMAETRKGSLSCHLNFDQEEGS
eukprot:5208369-Amphidinium_carterae.1